MAYSLVTTYGFNSKIGNMSFPPTQDGQMEATRPFSERQAELVDDEASSPPLASIICSTCPPRAMTDGSPHGSGGLSLLQVRQLVKAAYERTTALLTEKKELARGLAELLMEKEVMLHPAKDTYSQLHLTRSLSHRTQVIQRDEVESVLGVREWREATTYEELVAGKVLAGSFVERTFDVMP